MAIALYIFVSIFLAVAAGLYGFARGREKMLDEVVELHDLGVLDKAALNKLRRSI